MSDEGRFAGKVALITGGANGIGAATAARFAAGGADVVVADFDVAAAEKTAAAVGGRAVRCDVTSREDVEAAVAAAAEPRPARHPRHLRRDHPRQPPAQDDGRRLGVRDLDAPARHLPRRPGGPGAHGRAAQRGDGARLVDVGTREPRPGELLGRQGGNPGHDEDALDRARPVRDHGQLRRARLRRLRR